jgi:RimJ/RimL family protein N-acetyltransferase
VDRALDDAGEARAARELKTDSRNMRSRGAIERIGGRLDGVLLSHMPAWGGGVRDTALFSILESEWPRVKESLETRARLTG